MMNEGCVLTSCLHSGAIPLAHALNAEARPAWLETQSDLPAGTVARVLKSLCREYGSCGVIAVDGDQIVGKLRFSPMGPIDVEHQCVQQNPEAMAALDLRSLAARESLRPKSLSIWCLQVVKDASYRRKGIGRAMVQETISWAQEEGWDEIRALACSHIGPLLDWTGMFSVDAYQELGFTCTGRSVHPELLEGVRNMRAGHHGAEVKAQWGSYEHISDEEAGMIYDVVRRLR